MKTVSEEEKKKAKEQWDKGSVGFFEHNKSQKALDVFTKLPNNDRAKKIGQEYLAANKNMSSDDSRSLENMKKAIEALKVVNDKRQKDGGIDGRKLSVLKISDFDMAVAQANANYSANKIEHAGIHQPPFENLHWGGSDKGKEAIEGWWDQEKILFDYLRTKGCKSREEMGYYIALHSDEIFKDTGLSKDFQQVGHYTNLVDDLMWGQYYYGDSNTSGYAIRPGIFGYVQSLQLNYTKDNEAHSIEEYEKLFNDYCKNLQNLMNGIKTPSEEDLAKIEKLKKEIDALEKQIADKNSEIEKEKEDLQAINQDIENKKNENQEKINKLEENKKEIQRLEEEKKVLESEINNLTADINNLDIKIANHIASNKEYGEKLKALENDLASTNKELEDKNKEIKTLEDAKTKAEEEKNNLQNQILNLNERRKTLENNLTDKQKQLEEKKSEESTKNKEIEKLNEDSDKLNQNIENTNKNISDLKTKKDEAAKALAKANEDLKLANELLEQKNQEFESYSMAKENLAKAKRKVKTMKKVFEDLKKSKEDAENNLKLKNENLAKAEADFEIAQNIDLNNPQSYENIEEINKKAKAKEKAQIALDKAKENLDRQKEKTNKLKDEFDEATKRYAMALADFNFAQKDLERFMSVNINLDLDGGDLNGVLGNLAIKGQRNTKFKLPKPMKKGFKFLYWKDGDKIYYPNSEIYLKDNINLKAYWQELKETKEKTQRPKQKIKTKDNQSKIKIESPSTNNPKTGVGNKISIILTSSLSGLLYVLLRKRK
ncbi:hypothetical protein [Anaerococcus vaginalis]|uniref:hypothetical protein n=1 Tax=Anaerococcus vaginalis TaxID=33037 RepID=UPI0029083A04|nr:hypothetical protein [Anaerococcus vaginalis]MDU5824615.1 hypothetical protein [Anaerococcus vaginalis]